jgi:transposase
MRKSIRFVVGIDVGDAKSSLALLDTETGEERSLGSVATRRGAMEEALRRVPRGARVVLETGTHSSWIARQSQRQGLETVVADARRLELLTKNVRKSDEEDASLLARLGASSLDLLCPVAVRRAEDQQDLAVLRARDGVVAVRTQLINTVRGLVKVQGERIPQCDADSFAKVAAKARPADLAAAVDPMIELIGAITESIGKYDAEIGAICARRPETRRVLAVPFVGEITALAFVLAVGDPTRFRDARDVAAYLGLVPRRDQSGQSDRQLGISKTGDPLTRRLLVQCAHLMLRKRSPDSDLKRHGLRICARGGKNAKKRAAVAVARKLSVVLLVLWKKDVPYQATRTRAA